MSTNPTTQTDLFKIIEPALYNYPDKHYIDQALAELEAFVGRREVAAEVKARVQLVRSLVWHHSIADHAEDSLLKKADEWEAQLQQKQATLKSDERKEQ